MMQGDQDALGHPPRKARGIKMISDTLSNLVKLNHGEYSKF